MPRKEYTLTGSVSPQADGKKLANIMISTICMAPSFQKSCAKSANCRSQESLAREHHLVRNATRHAASVEASRIGRRGCDVGRTRQSVVGAGPKSAKVGRKEIELTRRCSKRGHVPRSGAKRCQFNQIWPGLGQVWDDFEQDGNRTRVVPERVFSNVLHSTAQQMNCRTPLRAAVS